MKTYLKVAGGCYVHHVTVASEGEQVDGGGIAAAFVLLGHLCLGRARPSVGGHVGRQEDLQRKR